MEPPSYCCRISMRAPAVRTPKSHREYSHWYGPISHDFFLPKTSFEQSGPSGADWRKEAITFKTEALVKVFAFAGCLPQPLQSPASLRSRNLRSVSVSGRNAVQCRYFRFL